MWRLQRDLFGDFMPNVVHLTGRGLQFWWHLEEASKKLLWLYEQFTNNIILLIENFLQDNTELQRVVEIDYVASRNPAGLFRLFGTFNSKTGHQSSYEIIHRDSYDLNKLKDALEKFEAIQIGSQTKTNNVTESKPQKTINQESTHCSQKPSRTRTAQFKRK